MKKNLTIMSLGIFIYGCIATGEIQGAMNAGMRLWKENCSRCHNIPSLDTFSDAEWEVVGSHMRLRANLTEKEASEIIRFIKTAN